MEVDFAVETRSGDAASGVGAEGRAAVAAARRLVRADETAAAGVDSDSTDGLASTVDLSPLLPIAIAFLLRFGLLASDDDLSTPSTSVVAVSSTTLRY